MREWSKDHPQAALLERKRAAIVAAARRLFLHGGYAETSMEAVAREAGVSIKTVYRHFEGKDDLFEAVMTMACSQKRGDGCRPDCTSSEHALKAIGRAHLSRILDPEEIALYRVVVRDAQRFPELGKRYLRSGPEHARAWLTEALRDIDRMGLLRVPDPAASAELFAGMLGAGLFERALHEGRESVSAADIEAHLDRCTSAMTALLKPGAAAA